MSRRTPRVVCALLCALAALSITPAVAGAASAPAGFRPFAPDSVWNLPLRADAPLDAHSSSYVTWLNEQIAAHGDWINTTSCGMPLYWADATTPRVKVTLDKSVYQEPALIRAWSSVPMPAAAKPANCGDKNLAVAQVQPDGSIREWEFWRAAKSSTGAWTAKWGGATTDVRVDRGIASSLAWTDPTATTTAAHSSFNWNVTASSISMMAGVITRADVAGGHINHALALHITDAAKGRFAWPAQRTDGTSTATYALPEGAHLRLDPKLNLSTISMTPLVRMIAEAAQKYGIVIRDRTYSTNTFIAEEPQAGQTDPFKPLLGGLQPNAALKAFPWSRLQLIKAPSCSSWGECKAPESVAIALSTSTPKVGTALTIDTTNSTLNQPRAQVRWDLDGNGTYESGGDKAVKKTFTPGKAGTLTIGVQITTRAGTVVTGKRTITVAPSA
jgi:hypothetical protein